MSARCSLCNREVDPTSSQTLHRIEAWERRALGSTSRRGGSDVIGRQRTGQYAHEFCVSQMKRGINPQQGVLS